MDFTAYKQCLVSASRFGAALVFASGTIYLLYHPRGPLYYWQLTFLIGLTLLSAGFPFAWILFPRRHPVYRALTAHGDARSTAERLDREMAQPHMVHEPFHFTASLLVYSAGYTLDVVPYHVISAALKESPVGVDAVPAIVVHTKDGRTYRWPRTWIQGNFDPDQVLISISKRANFRS